MKKALVIMAKSPHDVPVKSRLCPPLDESQARLLYECFLKDVLAQVRTLRDLDLYIAYFPATAGDYFHQLSAHHFQTMSQIGEELGDRMQGVFQQLFAQSHGAVILMGCDSPSLPLEFVEQAFENLEKDDADLVVGPSKDGGYYLIGLKREQPSLFADIPWSTEKVLAETVERAQSAGLKIVCLPLWYDVDTIEDLKFLKTELQQDTAPHTFHYLAQLDLA
ncbi:MAG: TIGR04282 family arsenosugar biosynthesis glycosyltransferase [Acidobacteria bacterium]|nr:TIGR04282 family arsenosugar biosynthesis glycosyltransferase [Acidobacteriota bacterium]